MCIIVSEYIALCISLSVVLCLLGLLTCVCAFCIVACNWASGEDDHVVARAEYDFTAASEEEISLQAGDMLNLAPKGKQNILY